MMVPPLPVSKTMGFGEQGEIRVFSSFLLEGVRAREALGPGVGGSSVAVTQVPDAEPRS